MTKNGHFVKDFDSLLFSSIGGSEGCNLQVYDDSTGVPTIGYGTALVIRIGKWKVLPKLDIKFKDFGIDLNSVEYKEDMEQLNKIAIALNIKNRTLAKEMIANYHFKIKLSNGSQAKQLYKSQIESFLDIVHNKFKLIDKTDVYQDLYGTRELVVLADLAYNGPSLVSKELVGYVAQKQRQKAFYYIAYKARARMNLDQLRGYVVRSYREAYLYGYCDGEQATDEEVKAMEELYAEHRDEIDAYDEKWGPLLKKSINGWKPFAELITAAKKGTIITWEPPPRHQEKIRRHGVPPPHIALLQKHLLSHSLPQEVGVSVSELILQRFKW